MEHQPFRTWILEKEPLTIEEQSRLEDHLAACPECARLSGNLERALHIVHSAPEVPAPEGFTRRWQASLAQRKHAEEKREARNLVFSLIGSAIVVAIGAILIFDPKVSLISLAAGSLTSFFTVVASAESVIEFITSLARSLNPSILALVLIILGGWILLSAFTLALSIWKLAIKRGVKNS
ncbi:MAG TPA: hypothetical protein PLV27_02745 [Anaerolineaceae bacterium]|nr:hypothetical protein [Anaerolineaceae bacterium]